MGKYTLISAAICYSGYKLDILLFFCLELECGLGVNEHFFSSLQDCFISHISFDLCNSSWGRPVKALLASVIYILE